MTKKTNLLLGTACVAICAVCGALSVWSLLQRDSIHVQVAPTDLNSHEVPIRYVGGRPLVDCLINERPAIMAIDTGANTVVINEASLTRFRIDKGSRSHTVLVPGGSIEARRLSTFTIAFPSVGISAEIRGAECARFENVTHDGLLGSNFLHEISARIDYRRGVLEFQCKTDAKRK